MTTPFVSIIVPTFNSSQTIQAALNSILNQSMQSYYEIIIIDAKSTDATLNKIDQCCTEQVEIRVVSEKDNGVYDAMNKGIKLSKGQWLYFLGSDDTLFNDHVLEDASSFLKDPQLDVVYGNVSSPLYGEKYDGEFTEWKIPFKNIAHQAIFYRKTLFEKIGNYNLKYRMLADWDLNLRWMINKKIRRKYIDVTIANYATGGMSEVVRDEIFYADFQKLLKQYGYKKVNLKAKIRNFIKRLTDY